MTLLLVAGAAPAQMPFVCTGQAFVVQDVDALLHEVDHSPQGPVLDAICPSAGREYNNIGFRRQDGMLYALELTPGGNAEILRIDADCNVTGLGRPSGLPSGPRFDAGDVSDDGNTLFISTVNHNLFKVDLSGLPTLPLPPVGFKFITGDTGNLHDWAYNPADGKLYGGDNTHGELAMLDPETGIRTDQPLDGLPSGTAFGAAWFHAGHLFLYRNDGMIYEVDVSVPVIVDEHPAQGSNRNDAAACTQDVVALAKRMTASSSSLVSAITLEFEFENLSSLETVFDLSAEDCLTSVFGAHGTDWSFVSIFSDPPGFANPGFDGHSDKELINQAPAQSLLPGATASVTVDVQVHTTSNLDPNGQFCNQALVVGRLADGSLLGDLSTDGLVPDPDGNGHPEEQEPSCLSGIPAVELVKSGALDLGSDGVANPGDLIHYTFDMTNTGDVTLLNVTLSDPMVSPIDCPSGHPIPSMVAGASETCTGSYSITQADIDAGQKHNTATVTGDAPDGSQVTDQDSHTEPIPAGACGCEGKVTTLTLEYQGSVAAQILVTGKFGSKSGEIFDGLVLAGGTFTIVGPSGNPFKGTLGTDIQLFVDGVFNAEIHTSCSQDVGPGQVAGDFLVLSGESKEGGALCPFPG